MVRYVFRWDLRKADPNAALSPPKEPIVFWIDNAVPLEYRPAVREGLLMWNKAFERIGIKDAIVVKQMPDDADWDHADMRYNVIRWTTSPGYGYAVALFRANPLTGQILNAGITGQLLAHPLPQAGAARARGSRLLLRGEGAGGAGHAPDSL